MKIIKKIDDEEMIAFVASKLSEKGMDSKYMPDAVHAFNGTVQYRKSGFGTFLKGYQKLGWIGLLVGFVLSFFVIPKLSSPYPLFGEADQGALVLNMVVEMIKFLCYLVGVVWFFVWLFYWQAPLKHCDVCNGVFCRVEIFEKEFSDASVDAVDTRTQTENINDNLGRKIGSYEYNVNVNVKRVPYYTVFQCKKCRQKKIELLVKQFDK